MNFPKEKNIKSLTIELAYWVAKKNVEEVSNCEVQLRKLKYEKLNKKV